MSFGPRRLRHKIVDEVDAADTNEPVLMADQKRLIELALKGLEVERDRIDEEIAQLLKQLRGADQTQPRRQNLERENGLHMGSVLRAGAYDRVCESEAPPL